MIGELLSFHRLHVAMQLIGTHGGQRLQLASAGPSAPVCFRPKADRSKRDPHTQPVLWLTLS